MRLPAPLTAVIVVATLAASFAEAPIAHAAVTGLTPYGVTWTVDTGANSLSEYAPGASGHTAPIATIKGAATGLAAPTAVAMGAGGSLYVANSGNNSITEYRGNTTGNMAPIATIKGSETGLAGPSSLAIGEGEVWVTDPSTNVVEAFTTGTSGNELPAQTIAGHKTLLDHPVGIALDNESDGLGDIGLGGIYVINAPTTGAASISAYLSGNVGNVAPDAQVKGTKKHPLGSPSAILSTEFGQVWVSDRTGNSVSAYFVIPGLTGIPSPVTTSSHPTAATAVTERSGAGGLAFETIAGSATGLDAPTGLSVDALGQLVVTNAGNHSVRIFGADATGNVAPIHTLSGVGTDSTSPAGLAVYGAPPSQPLDFKVAMHRHKTDGTATLSWQPPSVTGGGIIGYQVIAFNESSLAGVLEVLVGGGIGGIGEGAAITTRHTTFTEKHVKLGADYVFAVVAVNAFGDSRPSRAAFRTLAIAASAPRKVSVSSRRHALAVRWKPPAKDGGRPVTAYRVDHATCVPGTSGCAFHSRFVSRRLRFVTLRGLHSGTKYYVRVLAKTQHGLGAPSRTVSITTQG